MAILWISLGIVIGAACVEAFFPRKNIVVIPEEALERAFAKAGELRIKNVIEIEGVTLDCETSTTRKRLH